ncbi:MAG: hypothetical protein ACKV2O_18705 [Acidimicrobiales bacterium]
MGTACLSVAGCETLRPSISAGDTLSTKYGPARVELVQRSSGGPIYRLVFASCHPDMAGGTFDPAADAGVKAPPSLQKRWIWSCKG